MSAPFNGPKTAMVLAAGLGTRMRPLTDDRPKALVEVGGKALIDHMLDRLAEAGVERAVVNVHAFADRLEAHLKRRQGGPKIIISDERDFPRETGGGIKFARPLLGDAPIWVANIDSIWIEHGPSALAAVASAWDSERMDVCMLTAQTTTSLGFHQTGDLFLNQCSEVRFKDAGETAPLVYVGVHITAPRLFDPLDDGVFGLLPLWKTLSAKGRVHGVAPPGLWMHVGDPGARDDAEVRLRETAGS